MSHSHTWKTWNGKGHQEIWLLSCFKKRRLKASIKYMFLLLLASCCHGNPSSGAKAYGTGPGKHLWYDVFHVAELGWLSWCKKQPVEKEEPNIQPPRLVTGTIKTDTNQQKRRVLNKYTSMITVRYKWPIIQPVFQRQRNCLIIALIPGGTFPRNKLYNAPTNLRLQPPLGSAGELSTWLGAGFFEPRSNEMDWMSNVQMFLLDNVVGHCFKIESTPSPHNKYKICVYYEANKTTAISRAHSFKDIPIIHQSLPGRLGEVSAGDALSDKPVNSSTHVAGLGDIES